MRRAKLQDVFIRPRRTAWMAMRLLPADKRSIQETARRVGTTMTNYLLGLHRFAVGDSKRDA